MQSDPTCELRHSPFRVSRRDLSFDWLQAHFSPNGRPLRIYLH